MPPQPVHLDADPTRLAQVFANLLNNAAKYTEKAGHIWLTAERRDGEAVVSVRDTGIGIAMRAAGEKRIWCLRACQIELRALLWRPLSWPDQGST